MNGLTCEECGRKAYRCRIRNHMATYWCVDHGALQVSIGQAGDQWIAVHETAS